jgi:DNA (cytosine-5)-methyltransferase 1
VEGAQSDRRFALRVSIEKDPIAHGTLSLRALFRSFGKDAAPDCYYDYIRGKISRQQLLTHPQVTEDSVHSMHEAKNAELGVTPHAEVDDWISKAISDAPDWVLIGGPPCQAYSLAGRSRMRGADPEKFEKDKRHFLYTEYLRIIRRFKPSIFVMENVKGMLSSTHGGAPIFERIIEDFTAPIGGVRYEIRSLVVKGTAEHLRPQDFVIEAERYGIPQKRHRVILLGIRSDYSHIPHKLLELSREPVSVEQTISDLPHLRSRLSSRDSDEDWLNAIRGTKSLLDDWHHPYSSAVRRAASEAGKAASRNSSVGLPFIRKEKGTSSLMSRHRMWYQDKRLKGWAQHESRGHMASDLQRYMFASCFAQETKASPKLADFPDVLLPAHVNARDAAAPFADRFRVQLAESPASTIVSHIAKDGHYYIHPDPAQCRSLTVREAARIQTFPDNYFFEGNRTQQYHQVGNAVPPLLAREIARIVSDFISLAELERSRR